MQPPPLRLDDVEIGVAKPAGEDSDEHLARPGRVDRELLDRGLRIRLGVDDSARHAFVTVPGTDTQVSRGSPQLLVERHER